MDAKKTGSLIALLRREQRMTQKELADILYISGSIKVRFFSRGHGILYWYCNHHGLFNKRI